MKLSIFYFCLLFAFGSTQISIPELIEKLRDAIPEVIAIDELNVELPDNKYATGYMNVSDFSLTGVKEFKVDLDSSSTIPKYFALAVDAININLNYFSDILLLNSTLLSVFGEGTGSVVLTDFTVDGNISLSIIPIKLTINNMKMHLDSGKFTFDGLLNDNIFSKQISDVLSDNAANVFNENESALSSVVQDVLNEVIAKIISGNKTLTETHAEEEDKMIVLDYTEIEGAFTQENIDNFFNLFLEKLKALIDQYINVDE